MINMKKIVCILRQNHHNMASESPVADASQKKPKTNKKQTASAIIYHKCRIIFCFSFVCNMTNLSRKKAHRSLDEHEYNLIF